MTKLRMYNRKAGKMTKDLEVVAAFAKPRKQYTNYQHNDGHVLYAYGQIVTMEREQQGDCLDDWILDLTPEGCTGILIWEGACTNKWCMNHGDEWEPRMEGRWRKPTATELWAIANGTFKLEAAAVQSETTKEEN